MVMTPFDGKAIKSNPGAMIFNQGQPEPQSGSKWILTGFCLWVMSIDCMSCQEEKGQKGT